MHKIQRRLDRMSVETDREDIATFLYEEHRVERYSIGVRLRGVGEYLPMWHEISEEDQHEWVRKAARLQDHLRLMRRSRRDVAAARA